MSSTTITVHPGTIELVTSSQWQTRTLANTKTITRKCTTLWGKPDRVHAQNMEQLHAFDCHQNVAEPQVKENHKIYTSVHSNCESGLVIIYKHAAHRLVQHRLVQHRLQVVIASFSTPPIHTPTHTKHPHPHTHHSHCSPFLFLLPEAFNPFMNSSHVSIPSLWAGWAWVRTHAETVWHFAAY